MPHCDPDVLALRALGEDSGSTDDDAHLASCAECRRELDELRAVARTARTTGPDDRPEEPPARVWEAIHRELGLAGAVRHPGAVSDPGVVVGPGAGASPPEIPGAGPPEIPGAGPPEIPGAGPSEIPRTGPSEIPSTGPSEVPRARPSEVPGSGPADLPEGGAPPVPLQPRRARRAAAPLLLAAAAVVGVVVGALGTWLAVRPAEPDAGQQNQIVASTTLDPLPDWDAQGSAVVEQAADGTRLLVLDMSADDADGYREVWLIDREVQRLVSLGVMGGASGTFPIPAGLDLGEYPVVDVSLEPYDGDPAHSGDSIVRGTLDT